MSRALRVVGLSSAVLVVLAAGCKKEKGLRITDIEPKAGPYTGGASVTIHGSGFEEGGAKGVKVYFGDHDAKVLDFQGDDTLRVETPPGEVNKDVDVLLVF